jgi:hypothetical protein
MIEKMVRKLVRYRLPYTQLQERDTERDDEVWCAAGYRCLLFRKLYAGCAVSREPYTDNSTYVDWLSIRRLRHMKCRTYQITEGSSVKGRVKVTERCGRLWCCTLQ